MKSSLLLALVALPLCFAVFGVDVSQLGTVSTYQCLYNNGFRFAIPRGYLSYGANDPNAKQNIANAKSAGFQYVDTYFFPCSGKSAISQADSFYNALAMTELSHEEMIPVSDGTLDNHQGMRAGYYEGWEKDIDLSVYEGQEMRVESSELPEWRKETLGKSYGMVWVDVEINPSSGCGWGKDYASNCEFVQELVGRLKYHGLTVGVYSSEYMWSTVMGSLTACPQVASGTQYWYAHYDNMASFSDFRVTGGWKTPAIKQYKGDDSLCGIGIDRNVY